MHEIAQSIRLPTPDKLPDAAAMSRWRWGILVPLLGVVFTLSTHPLQQLQANEPTPIASPEELWRGFDPNALPLEIESIRRWQEADIAFEALRFTGEIAAGKPVRVYAIQAAPIAGTKFPGILHVHGGGQTASLEWVRFWAKRGYVAVTFDFCGRVKGRDQVTDWGPIPQGNMMETRGGARTTASRDSPWYHWALVSRRALTLLARHPQADAERLGVFGISVGGSLTWMIAGSDQRVKAAAPIYGCGYNHDRHNVIWGMSPPTPELIVFQKTLSSEAHAPFISCPVFFLDATNDFHGTMDRAYQTLAATTGPKWQAFTSRTNHHIAPAQGRNLPLWFDWQLKGGPAFPQTPAIRIILDATGIPKAIVEPGSTDTVVDVEVFYSLGEKRPQARFWRGLPASPMDKSWQADLPVLDTWDDLRAFANVTYRTGVCLSTPLRHIVPAQIGKARSTLAWSNAPTTGKSGIDYWFFTTGYTDPVADWSILEYGRDDRVGPYVAFNRKHLGNPIPVKLSTHIIGDPQFQGHDGCALAFQCRGAFTAKGLTVSVVEDDWGQRSKTYSTTIPQSKIVDGWREVKISLTEFLDDKKQPPAKWQSLDKLEIQGLADRSTPPQFANLHWVENLSEAGRAK